MTLILKIYRSTLWFILGLVVESIPSLCDLNLVVYHSVGHAVYYEFNKEVKLEDKHFIKLNEKFREVAKNNYKSL
jgi:hypothetical protein